MIKVELAIPGTFVEETSLGTWAVSAANASRLRQELARASFLALEDEQQVERLGALCDDGTLLYVPAGGKRFWLYRTINATRELYFRQDACGNWVVTDHFRNMLAGIPRRERELGENAMLDHFLILYPLGESTLVRKARRVTPGEVRFVDAVTGEEVSRQAEKFAPEAAEMGVEEAPDALGEVLRAALADQGPDDCTLFSGGVDSTLVHLLRPKGSPALTVTVDTPEFAFEVEYAREAARLLGASWFHVPFREEEYLELFLETIETLGQPVHPSLQPVFMNRAFREPFRVFWIGDCADTLFGHPQLRRVLQGEVGPRLERQLEEPSDSLSGYGALSNTGPDLAVVSGLFGEGPVMRRIEARMGYVLGRGSIRPGSRLEEHAAMDSLVETFCSTLPAITCKRENAAAFGGQTREPFFSRAALRLAGSIPTGQRFFHGGESKPVPKALLRKLLPEYPFYGKKGGSDIPRTRFCQSGPFRDFFHGSDFPDLLPPGGREMLMDPQWDWSYLYLKAAAFSTWQDLVLRSDALQRVPGTRLLGFGEEGVFEEDGR